MNSDVELTTFYSYALLAYPWLPEPENFEDKDFELILLAHSVFYLISTESYLPYAFLSWIKEMVDYHSELKR